MTSQTIIIIGVVVGLVFFIGIGMTYKVPYTVEVDKKVQEPYTDTEYYTEKEPYTDIEYYTETVPSSDQECESQYLIYKDTDTDRDVSCSSSHEECTDYFLGICTSSKTVCDTYLESVSFSITNLDSKQGTWSIEWYTQCRENQPLCTSSGKSLVKTTSLIIDPTETKTASYQITYDSNGQKYLSGSYSVPTKEVCRDVTIYTEEQRTREVTKYRDVQKSRDVTKYRTVTKTESETKYRTLFEDWGII